MALANLEIGYHHDVVRDYAELADAIAITSPQAIIFFGGLARAGEMLMKHVRTHMEANLLKVYKNKVQLLYSALPDADAAILGASALVW